MPSLSSYLSSVILVLLPILSTVEGFKDFRLVAQIRKEIEKVTSFKEGLNPTIYTKVKILFDYVKIFKYNKNMIIGVLSDTHDRLDSLKLAIEVFKKNHVEEIVHCGDWISPFTLEYLDYITGDFKIPIQSVFGNNEGDIRRIIERNSKL